MSIEMVGESEQIQHILCAFNFFIVHYGAI